MTRKRVKAETIETYSLSEVASLFRVDQGTVRRWIRAGCPYLTKADRSRSIPWEFDLVAVVAWRVESSVEAQVPDPEKVTLEQARRRDAVASAELREIELARTRGELVTIADVENDVAREYGIVRRRLRAMPETLADQLAITTTAAEARDVLDEAIDETLRELSSGREVEDDDVDEPGSVAPAADRNAPQRPRKTRAGAKKTTRRAAPSKAKAKPKRVGGRGARSKSGGQRRSR